MSKYTEKSDLGPYCLQNRPSKNISKRADAKSFDWPEKG